MKNNITVLLAIVVLASCSTPKYSYYFDRTDYYAGKKESRSSKEVSPLAVDSQQLVATTSGQPVVLAPVVESPVAPVEKTYLQMNKAEKKEVRQQLKKAMKSYVAKKADSEKTTHAGQAIDNDLKLAAIFGAVGIVGLIIGGNAFNIIGGIALIIGVVFFVKWLIRQ